MKPTRSPLPRRLRKRHWFAAAVALSSSSAFAAKRPEPVILTLDGKHYVSYQTVEFDPANHLVLAPDAGMSNCQPTPDDGGAPGSFDLVYSDAGDLVSVDTIALHFAPTQLVMTTALGNVVCEGQALGWQTGFDRIYADEFDADQ
ncbi:hypothetical protein [Chiayiivirga flava]|uniref:Uncharacterized protein n=1 Tax=Chiayiivirga flava TaxID=659595 RepID=A0A7W8G188_9GAMM|nr:hypothetical protein [Chiayiivirga flava]MBB5207410.1 hypothetical protein [Chiayiivirga flava]